jgi:hypothetical protein
MSFVQGLVLIAGTALTTIVFVRNNMATPLHRRISGLDRRLKMMTDFLEANTSYRNPSS